MSPKNYVELAERLGLAYCEYCDRWLPKECFCSFCGYCAECCTSHEYQGEPLPEIYGHAFEDE
jgi:hypothetical protein